MEQNPYIPPQSRLSDSQDSLAPRPLSTWLILIFLVGIALLLGIGVARGLWSVVADATGAPTLSQTVVPLIARFAAMLVLLATANGISRRKPWSRWLAILPLAALALWSILAPDTTYYANDAERTGGGLGRVFLFPLILAGWAYAFGFSSKAKRYFALTEPDTGPAAQSSSPAPQESGK